MDDRLGRRLAQAAGLPVWGMIRVLLEAKAGGIIPQVDPHVDALTRWDVDFGVGMEALHTDTLRRSSC